MQGKLLSILIYHRVLDQVDELRPGEVTVRQFDKQMAMIKKLYNVVNLEHAIDAINNKQLPPRAVAITFDDGYKDNYENALPILLKHKLNATFFIATGFLNNGIMWNDIVIECMRRTIKTKIDLEEFGLGVHVLNGNRLKVMQDLIGKLKYFPLDERNDIVKELPSRMNVTCPDDLMMSDDNVRAMYENGMNIGGHTVNHPILARIDRYTASKEIEAGKIYLENIIGNNLRLFAYPNGKPNQDYTREHVEIIRELGFDAAVSTAWGVAGKHSDKYQLPRFTPWDNSRIKFALRLEKMRWSGRELCAE